MKILIIFLYTMIFSFVVFAQELPEIEFDPLSGNYIIKYLGVEGDTIETVFEPSTKIVPTTNAIISFDQNKYIYEYILSNGINSQQRLYSFSVEYFSELINESQPDSSWYSGKFKYLDIKTWANIKSSYGVRTQYDGIAPDSSQDGFIIESLGLPSIVQCYSRGLSSALFFPEEPPIDLIDLLRQLRDFPNNTIIKKTIGPKDPPDPFIPSNFLDTLRNYTQRSYELGWITNQTTADKYDSLLNTAKTLLEGNHIPWVEYTLQSVIDECNEDSSGNITSEAYALLRYNTEYLLENLPEVIPGLNFISPSLALPYDGGVEFLPLTVTLIGNYFSDSSIVYFDDQPYVANFISDSILTFHITDESYLKNTGDYPVWVSNYEVNSNTLYFSVVDNFPEELTPIVECVQDNQNGTYTAFFGYNNDNETTVFIHIGQQNNVYDDVSEFYGEAPVIFLPGRHENVFTKEFHTGRSINWLLNNESVQANEGSTACP